LGEIVSFENVNRAPVLLVSWRVFAALFTFSAWLPKLRLVGAKVMVVLAPVPVNPTLCGLFAALSAITTDPTFVPTAVGSKVTFIVQLAPAATEAPQVLVSE
jgi:hypothetical protein